MARRRRKKSMLKPVINILIMIVLLVIIFFLVQKFIMPLWQKQPVIEEEVHDEIAQKPPIKIEEEDVLLYFSDENAEYLVPEHRKVNSSPDVAKSAVIELIKGPYNHELYPTVPSTTKVNALYISDGIAYVDLSSDVIKDHPGGSTGELLTVYSIVMTLTSFPDIHRVQILVDGNSGETLAGHLDISIPLERDEHWLKR